MLSARSGTLIREVVDRGRYEAKILLPASRPCDLIDAFVLDGSILLSPSATPFIRLPFDQSGTRYAVGF